MDQDAEALQLIAQFEATYKKQADQDSQLQLEFELLTTSVMIHVKNKDYTKGIAAMERLGVINPEYMKDPYNLM